MTNETSLQHRDPETVNIGPGHLGITLSNHSLGVQVDKAHEADSIFQAGIRVGDVIIAVDDVTVTHHSDACDLLGSNIAKPVVLTPGAVARHTVTYYPKAVADAIVASQGFLDGLLPMGWLSGSDASRPRPVAGPKAEEAQAQAQGSVEAGRSARGAFTSSFLWIIVGLALAKILPLPWELFRDAVYSRSGNVQGDGEWL